MATTAINNAVTSSVYNFVCEYRTASNPSTTRAGLALFFKLEEELTQNLDPQLPSIAKSKGVELPDTINTLPDHTLAILKEHGILPTFVNASVDGDLMIEFDYNDNYHMIEFFQDGDIVFLKRGRKGREIWDLDKDTYISRLNKELLSEQDLELV